MPYVVKGSSILSRIAQVISAEGVRNGGGQSPSGLVAADDGIEVASDKSIEVVNILN